MATDLLMGLLPEHLLLGLLLVLMLLETFRLDARWGQVAFVATMLAGIAIVLQQAAADYAVEVVPGEIRIDRVAVLGKLVLLACGATVGVSFVPRESHKFWLLVSSSLLGGAVILDSAGFVSLFIGIEMLSLPAFALIVHGRGESVASEGAIKYLTLSSVGTALVLLGASLAYGQSGTLSIAAWAQLLAQGSGAGKAAVLLVLCGLFLKAAVFPFHGWAPDAYASARIPVTGFLASIVKAGVVLALVRIVTVLPLDAASSAAIGVLAIASIAFGNLAALNQQRFRRLLAYSSVAHAGYMIFALLDTTGNRVDDLVIYVVIYALATLLACAAIAVLCAGDDDALDTLDGKFATRPVASLLLALAVLSLAGVPPLPGFFAKLLVFRSVIASGYLIPAVVAFAGSFLGLAYYVGIVLRLFRSDARSAPSRAGESAGRAPV